MKHFTCAMCTSELNPFVRATFLTMRAIATFCLLCPFCYSFRMFFPRRLFSRVVSFANIFRMEIKTKSNRNWSKHTCFISLDFCIVKESSNGMDDGIPFIFITLKLILLFSSSSESPVHFTGIFRFAAIVKSFQRKCAETFSSSFFSS